MRAFSDLFVIAGDTTSFFALPKLESSHETKLSVRSSSGVSQSAFFKEGEPNLLANSIETAGENTVSKTISNATKNESCEQTVHALLRY